MIGLKSSMVDRMLGIRLKAKRILNRAIISSDLLYANISYTWQVINRVGTYGQRLGDPIWSRDSQEALYDENLASTFTPRKGTRPSVFWLALTVRRKSAPCSVSCRKTLAACGGHPPGGEHPRDRAL